METKKKIVSNENYLDLKKKRIKNTKEIE